MGHTWRFFRAGGFDQARLDTGADIAALGTLDPKLWVALACPVKGLEFDPHTLELLDADKDGRIRVPEVVEAARWTTSLLKNPDELSQTTPRSCRWSQSTPRTTKASRCSPRPGSCCSTSAKATRRPSRRATPPIR